MAAMCRENALEDRDRKQEWLDQAEMWNQLAGAEIGHSFEERIKNASGELGSGPIKFLTG
jgi:hypothetical protein